MSMEELFKNHIATISDRYFQAMEKHGFDHLLIPAGSLHGVFLDDNKYPFKANFHFNSFVPLTQIHDSCLMLTPGKKPLLCYYQPVDFWHLVAGDPAGFWVEHFDIKMMRQKDEVRAVMPSTGNIAFIGEMGAPYQDDDFDAINPLGLIHEINWHRARKTAYEVECASRANQMAAAGHLAAKEMFYNQGSELEIHLAYQLATGQNESELPYGSIVALNQNASILHYVNYEAQAPQEHRTFLIDAGARYNGYASDVTRTYAYQQNQFAELITDLDRIQQAINQKVKPGHSYVDLHIDYHLDVAKLLNKHDICDMSPESQLETGITSGFFPHGLGHQIGLQVHDVGGHQANIEGDTAPPPAEHPFLRNTRPMEAGQILTIEPGLYFIDSLLADLKASEHGNSINWNTIAELMPYGGIRIEDDVLVTATGHRNLTREHLPD
ncbi:Xaa-Pro dipeptidase [Kangiella sp. TOML190]|uniref:Xaa-Pro dipeptidase n=1 Tax=Kangiella sp. TOML190 TaxID=2931351 RepID=UPI00203B1522|nr:Xaa-Pro dipeptidase [Kangiella sp. TOML190]